MNVYGTTIVFLGTGGLNCFQLIQTFKANEPCKSGTCCFNND